MDINDPVFRQKMVKSSSSSVPLKEYVVSGEDFDSLDERMKEEEMADLDKRLNQARIDKLNSETKVSAFAKEQIEYLSGIGRITKDITLGNITFTLRTLKKKEADEAVSTSIKKNYSSDLELGEGIRKERLARSLYKINGKTLQEVFGSNKLELVLLFLEDLEDSVANKLQKAYEEMKQAADTQFDVKSEQEQKELVENIKK